MQAMGRKFWKTPYFQDYEPIFMAESRGDLDKMWIGWRTHHNVWSVYDMEGNAKGSIGSKVVQFGMDTLKHPCGDVSCPPLDPNLGSHGTPKFYCVNSNIVDEVKAMRERKMQVVKKLGAVANSKMSRKDKPRPTRKRSLGVPEPLEGPKSSTWRPQPSPPSVPPPAHLTVLEPPAPPVPLQPPLDPLPPWRTTTTSPPPAPLPPPAPSAPQSPPSPPAPPAAPADYVRKGWMMKCKELVVAYELKWYQRFEELADEYLY